MTCVAKASKLLRKRTRRSPAVPTHDDGGDDASRLHHKGRGGAPCLDAQLDPLRPVREEAYRALEHLSRSRSQPAVHVSRAKALLAVVSGYSYTQAARVAGYRVGDTVAWLLARFNTEGLNALQPRHGGGKPPSYGVAQVERILTEVRRLPDRNVDGNLVA